MTLEELCNEIGRSENTILKHFKRTQETLAKQGIYIEKYGAGRTAKYTLEYKRVEEKE